MNIDMKDSNLSPTTASVVSWSAETVKVVLTAEKDELIELAVSLSAAVKPKDLVVTLNSEEFAVLEEANPGWSVSKQLGAPYKYFPEATEGELVLLPEIHTIKSRWAVEVSRWKVDSGTSMSSLISDIFLVRKKFGFRVFERIS